MSCFFELEILWQVDLAGSPGYGAFIRHFHTGGESRALQNAEASWSGDLYRSECRERSSSMLSILRAFAAVAGPI